MKGCRCPSVRSHLVEPLNKVSLEDYNAIAKRTQSSAKASYWGVRRRVGATRAGMEIGNLDTYLLKSVAGN